MFSSSYFPLEAGLYFSPGSASKPPGVGMARRWRGAELRVILFCVSPSAAEEL
jgi:hypothetical protein